MVRDIALGAVHIVHVDMLRGSHDRGGPLSRVTHVYKGSLRPGATLRLQIGWPIPAPMCAGLLGGPAPLPRGHHGVAAIWPGTEMRFLTDEQVALMLRLGLIAPRPDMPVRPAR